MVAASRSSRKPSKSLPRRREPICRRISGWVKDSRSFIRFVVFEASSAGEVGHPQSNQNFISNQTEEGILDGQPAESLTLGRDWPSGFGLTSVHGLTDDYAHKVCQFSGAGGANH